MTAFPLLSATNMPGRPTTREVTAVMELC